jgi:hypothetical protein
MEDRERGDQRSSSTKANGSNWKKVERNDKKDILNKKQGMDWNMNGRRRKRGRRDETKEKEKKKASRPDRSNPGMPFRYKFMVGSGKVLAEYLLRESARLWKRLCIPLST